MSNTAAPPPWVPAPVPPRQVTERRPSLSQRLEYLALRAFVGALAPLGARRAAGVAGAIARIGYRPFGIRRGVVERQVAAAFPGLDPSGVRDIARAAYDNLGRVAIEATLLSLRGPAAVLDHFVDSPDWGVVERAHARGKGVVLVAGHLGNWELSGAYVSAKGVPCHPIARGMSNPLSERFFRRTRERLGMHVMHDQEAVRRVPRILRDGGTVGFLSDQATVGLASTVLPFFGRPAKTPRGAAVFAIRAGAPVVLIQAIRERDGRYRFHAEELPTGATGDRERDVDEIILAFSGALEKLVRRYPGQYFWQHRRWKHQPADTPPHLREP
ncbi:MAG: lysophospholipid acyltransferase family protein [Gemmatimonadetes bacterium]|nr:lysophospholipid acyltransferase family protein [Gemmatimonadota bacterium]